MQALLVGLALLMALAGGAQGAKPVTLHCGQVITTDTSLANDLTDCPRDGIIIGASDITLDLNGHTIDGDGGGFESCETETGCDKGVDNSAGYDRVTIRDGAIREFVSGVRIVGADANRVQRLSTSHQAHGGVDAVESTNVMVERISSADDGGGIFLEHSSGATLERNSIARTEFAAIGLFGSDHVLIRANSISENGLSGIDLGPGSRENRIEGNSISHGFQGVWLEDSSHNVVSRNSVTGSEMSGVETLHDADHNLIAGNTLRGNRFIGMFVNGEANTARGNRVHESAFGISSGGTANQIVGNLVSDGVDQPCDEELQGNCFAIAIDTGSGNSVSDNFIERMSKGIEVFTGDPEIPPAAQTRVLSNVIRGVGGDGVHVDSTAIDSLLEGNLAVAAGDDGIDADSPTTTIAGNTANQNHDLGIEAVPGVTDGSGNRASGNGNPLQCTNVFCR